jgi:N-methylhydantoinase A
MTTGSPLGGADQPLGVRVGVDIGGTFTDGVLVDSKTGAIHVDKVPTTPDDPSEGFIRCVERLMTRGGVNPADFQYMVHATTVATNAMLERRGARVALLTTEGFRDVLEIARQIRHELYNLQTEKPRPLVPRERCLEVGERLDYRGEIVQPLDEGSVASAVATLRAQAVTSIAVCLLHAYQNPVHEHRTREIIRQLYPEASISLSSDIAPEIREYWRASTTVANAYVAPLVSAYLEAIERRLRARRIVSGLHIMQSSGGIMTVDTAKTRPILMLESGPAAGVAAAAYFANQVGCRSAISFDMGGTTAKVGLILDGQPRVVSEFEAGAAAGSGSGVAKGSGYPILAPMMDLVEVGAGGGSVAWIDSGGLLRVGPRSAGADPGPACYETGGTDPTVTDANLVLGRINPEYFLGGEMPLNVGAARAAIDAKCGRPLGLEVVEAAQGVIDIANATMVEAMRLVSVQRGHDPSEFTLIAFGGAGPLHANQLADELGIPLVAIPPAPGVASAWGMLVSDLRHDYRVTRLQPLAHARFDELNDLYRRFEEDALQTLLSEGVGSDDVVLQRNLDLRYVGQSSTLTVRVPATDLKPSDEVDLKKAFDAQHEQSYGYAVAGERVEIVTVSLLAMGRVAKPNMRRVQSEGGALAAAEKARRHVYFRELGGFVDCPVYDRQGLPEKARVSGPAVIEEPDSTTVLHPGYAAEVATYGTLLLRRVGFDGR